MKKKLFVAFLSAFMVTQSIASVAFAQTTNDTTIVKNEFVELQKMEEAGVIDDSYKEVMATQILELQKQDEDILESMGYNEEQIKAIKNFDGSDEMLEKAAATVTINCSVQSFEYYRTRDTSNATIKVDFQINGSFTGIINYQDLLGVVWSSDFDALQSSNLKVTYRNAYYNQNKTIEYSMFKNGLNSIGFKFDTHISFNSSDGLLGADIKSGKGYIYLTIPEKVNRIKVYTAYGHNSTSSSPNFSVSGTGTSVGISFGKKITDMGGETASKTITVIDRSIE